MRSADWLDRWHGATVRALATMEADAGTRSGFDIGHLSTACVLEYLDLRRADYDWRADAPALADWLAGVRDRDSLRQTRPS